MLPIVMLNPLLPKAHCTRTALRKEEAEGHLLCFVSGTESNPQAHIHSAHVEGDRC